MNWLNKKVTESPYKLAIIVGTIIPLVVSALMAEVQSWFPSLDSEGLEAINQLLAGSPVIVAVLLFAIVIFSPVVEELMFRKFLWWFSSLIVSF